MFRLLKSGTVGVRLLSTVSSQELKKSVFKLQSNILKPSSLFKQSNTTTTTSTTTIYENEISPLQIKLLEQYKNALIIPSQIAKELENVTISEPKLSNEEIKLDSVLRKRRLKMKKHKLRKRRKAQRALRRKLKKD